MWFKKKSFSMFTSTVETGLEVILDSHNLLCIQKSHQTFGNCKASPR
jgi:hypothetical protein